MAWLKLSPGRKVKVGLTFEHPDDEHVRIAADPEARAQFAQSTGVVDDDSLDTHIGLSSTPMAQLTVLTKQAIGQDTTVFMDKEELRRHVFEAMALLKAWDEFTPLVDRTMSEYRKKVREQVMKDEQG